MVHTEFRQGRHHRTGEVGCGPQVTGVGCPGGGCHLRPLSLTPRLVVSTALFPTCLATWSPGTPQAPVGCHLQTMPTCSVLSGPWPRRVSACWRAVGGRRGEGEGEESDACPCPAVHNSLSSVLAALTAEWDRLRDLHQGSELSRMGVRLKDRGACGRRGLEAEDRRPGEESGAGSGESGWRRRSAQRAVSRGGEGFVLLAPCPLTVSSQVSEASAGPRRLHSLSVSSDTTADSFSSLNPEEVGARLGCGNYFSCTFFLSRSEGMVGLQTQNRAQKS